MYPEAPSTPLRFVSIFSFLLNSFGFIDGKKKKTTTFFLPFFFFFFDEVHSQVLLSCSTQCDTEPCVLCVSGVVQEPQGPQEAAGLRVKGQAAVACAQPDLQHRPVASSSPACATWRSKVSWSAFATQQSWDPLGMIGKVESTLSCLESYIVCSCRVSFVNVWAFTHTKPLEQRRCSVVWLELWVVSWGVHRWFFVIQHTSSRMQLHSKASL